MFRLLRVMLPAALAVASPALGAVVDSPTGPVDLAEAAPAADVAAVAEAAPMAMMALEAAPAAEPIRVAVYTVGPVEGVLNSAGGIQATRIFALTDEALAGYDCLIARVHSGHPQQAIDAIRAFVANGGCYIGEWSGAAWAVSTEVPSVNFRYYTPGYLGTPFLELFQGSVSDGFVIQTDWPISVVQDHPVLAGVPNPFRGFGGTEFFFRSPPPYDPRLTTIATFEGYGATNNPAIQVGSTGRSRAVLMFFDAGDDPFQPALSTLWVNAVRWAAVRDDVPPVTTATLDGLVGNAGWYRSDVAVTLSATDDRSGVASTEYTLDGEVWSVYTAPFTVSNEGEMTVCYRSTDAAGNVEAPVCTALRIDKTAPAVEIASPAEAAEYLLRALVVADWSATDAVSGLASATGTVAPGEPVDTATVGPKSFSVFAQDVAGNETTVTVTYFVRYGFGGFLQPILPDGTGVYRLGSVLPVKFQLLDASGAVVDTATATLSVALRPAGAAIPAVPAGTSNVGNAFRFDLLELQYVFDLSTRLTPMSVGTWQLQAALDDGTVRTVDVTLQ